jgi:hypothetical protein
MSYDSARKRIYVTGEEGFISVIAQVDADHYEAIAKIAICRLTLRVRGFT